MEEAVSPAEGLDPPHDTPAARPRLSKNNNVNAKNSNKGDSADHPQARDFLHRHKSKGSDLSSHTLGVSRSRGTDSHTTKLR